MARTGHDAANFFLGIPGLSRLNKTRPWFHFQGPEYALYIQDNFKISPKLTLNLGLRAESFPIMAERDNMLTSFDPKAMAIVLGQPLDKMYQLGAPQCGRGEGLYRPGSEVHDAGSGGTAGRRCSRTDTVNWLPRLGFAYRATSGKHPIVLRGGYSRFGYPVPVGGYYARARSNPPLHISYTFNMNGSVQSPDGLANYLLRNAPVYVAGKNMQNMFSPETPTLGGIGSIGASYYDTYQPVTRVDQWNLTLEREVLPNTVLRLTYLGNHGAKLDQLYNYNEAIPNYVWFTETGLPLPQGADSGCGAARLHGSALRHARSAQEVRLVELQRRAGGGGAALFEGDRLSVVLRDEQFVPGGRQRLARRYSSRTPGCSPKASVPEDADARNRLLNYHLDPEIPKHRAALELAGGPAVRPRQSARRATPAPCWTG